MSEKIDMTQLQNLSKDELIMLILKQGEQIALLTQQVKALQEQLAKNSHNSHKPPSSDGLNKPKPKSLREKGKRTSGGQVGHAGKTLCLLDEPDQTVIHPLSSCPHCEQDLQSVKVEQVERRQVLDIPPVAVVVTEHQAEIKVCPGCGMRAKAGFPAEVSQTVQYGERLKGQIVYLSSYQMLPLARLLELLHDFYGVGASEGTVLATLTEFEQAVQPSIDAIRSQLPLARVVHCDETGMRVAGRTQWVHVVSNPQLTYYALHRQRGQTAIQAMGIVSRCQGYVVHDAYPTYFAFQHCQHALCNAHLLRELIFLWEEQGQDWAQDLKQLLLDIKKAVETLPASQSLEPEQVEGFIQAYQQLVASGWQANPPPEKPPSPQRGRVKQTKAQNLLQRLERYPEAVLAFLHDRRVPFDNNLAERDLRMVKVKQKVSGCFRTEAGAQTFLCLRSYISTVRKQGIKVLDALASALLGQPFIPSASLQAE